MSTVFACNIHAFSPEQRQRHSSLARGLREHGRLHALEDGYAFSFQPNAQRALELAEFMTLERLCCPFLTLEMMFAPDDGALTLRLRGEDGVKTFLEHELGLTALLESRG
jgi:hypothetical protein